MSIYLGTIIAFLSFFTLLGIRRQRLLNPLFVFNVIWLMCFILYALNISSVYTNNISGKAFLVIMAMTFSFNGLYFIGKYVKHSSIKASVNLILSKNKYLYIKKLFIFWIILTALETIYCRYIPLIWTILGRSENYATFGIPSIHGFINSLSWFVVSISFIYYLNTKDKRVIKFILITNFAYILLLARQSMTTEAIQLIAIYTIKRKVKFKRIAVFGILGVLIFGIVGNIRTNPMHVLATSGLGYESFPFFLMGIVWVYLYLMTPIANIINFINGYSNYLYGAASIGKFLPTVISTKLSLPTANATDYLVRQTYNVSTSLVQPYADFGIVGVIIFFSFLGFIGAKLWNRVKNPDAEDLDVCNYSVYLGIIALTFFSNMLLSLPIVMQLVYSNVLFRNYFSHPIETILIDDKRSI